MLFLANKQIPCPTTQLATNLRYLDWVLALNDEDLYQNMAKLSVEQQTTIVRAFNKCNYLSQVYFDYTCSSKVTMYPAIITSLVVTGLLRNRLPPRVLSEVITYVTGDQPDPVPNPR